MSRRAIRVAAPPSSAEEHWHLLLPEGFRFDDEGDSLEHETATIGSRTIVLREHITRLRAGDDVDQGQTEEGPVGPPPDTLHLHVKRDYPQTTPELRPKPTSDPPASAVSYTTVFYPPIMPTALFSASAVLENDGVDSKDGRHGDKQCSGISPFTLLQAAILLDTQRSPSAVATFGYARLLRSRIRPILQSFWALLSFRFLGIGSLSELTCTGRQLHVRTRRLLAVCGGEEGSPAKDQLSRVHEHNAHISRLNLLWVCMNDVIIGIALGSLIRDNRSMFLMVTETFVRTYVLGYLRDLLQWLSSWPMGIKLNDEVADVICRAFLGLSNLWEHVCLEPMLAHLPIAWIGFTGVLGASTLIGLVADLLSILTLPFFACYVVAAFTFRQSFSMLHALFDVFRGRKFNPLRNRTEPATYEVDELLLGTILFVMLSAIFPTIMAFYFAFASSRLLILSSQALLITAVEALDAFPLFLLLLRVKSPHRLPGRVELDPCDDRSHWPQPHSHLRIRILPYSAIFSPLTRVLSETLSLEIVPRTVACLWTGRLIWLRRPSGSAGSKD